ncbi:MAG TPA: hypothetical protein PKC91_01240 [Ignavibacteria bacterium]|nr:hypothetical protein [Ignavibacteria bacterium]
MRTVIVYFIFLLFFSFQLNGCDKESDPVTPNDPVTPGTGATRSFNSEENGSFNFDGFSIVIKNETVSRLQNGTAGSVVFSMNTSSSLESGVPALPSGHSIVSKYLKAGPEAFYFNLPVQIFFPASGESSPNGLVVFYFSQNSQDWKIVPVSAIDTAGKRVGIDVLELGYFVLAKKLSADDPLSDFRQGGCVFDYSELWTNFILTVNTAALEKPEQLALFSGGFIGGTYSGPVFLGCPEGKTKAIVPQGIISFWISKTVCQGSDRQVYTYSLPASVTVSDPLNFTGWTTYDAVTYVPFTLPAGGTWVLGRPSSVSGSWPPPTAPVGSGTFQATLTWYNSGGEVTDLDLHLYGPDNLHIYWQNRTSANFELDRDWISNLGNAIENIYSITYTVPSGNYDVKVKHFSGVTKNFNVRVILNGASTNFSGSASSGQEITVKSFTIQ